MRDNTHTHNQLLRKQQSLQGDYDLTPHQKVLSWGPNTPSEDLSRVPSAMRGPAGEIDESGQESGQECLEHDCLRNVPTPFPSFRGST